MDQVPRKQETAFFLAEAAEAEDSLKRIPNQRRGGRVLQHTRMHANKPWYSDEFTYGSLAGQAAGLTHSVNEKAKHRTNTKVGFRSKV